jgi:hypothetical protein
MVTYAPRIARILQHNRQTLVGRCSHERRVAIDLRGSHQRATCLDIVVTHPPPNARLHNGAGFVADDFLEPLVNNHTAGIQEL